MKNLISTLFCLLLACLVVPACKNDAPTSANQATTETPTTDALTMPAVTETPTDPLAAPATTTAQTAATTPPTKEPPQNASGVWHYTCPKGCKNGGGAATPCATCGTTLAHNTAYHGTAAKPASDPAAAATPSTTPTTTPTPEPAQNKAGVWHYTCADGCSGGAGAASPCAKCNKTLVHNTAYHQ
jgi:hypothetical protein